MSEEQAPSPLAPAVSPLLEADPNAINDLIRERINDIFNTPPLVLTDTELLVQIEYYRRERHRFALESAQKALKDPGERKTRKVPTSVKEALTPASDLL